MPLSTAMSSPQGRAGKAPAWSGVSLRGSWDFSPHDPKKAKTFLIPLGTSGSHPQLDCKRGELG